MGAKKSKGKRGRGNRENKNKRSPFTGQKRNWPKRYDNISQREQRMRERTVSSVFDPEELDEDTSSQTEDAPGPEETKKKDE